MSKVCTLTVVNEVFTMVTGLDKTTLNKCINKLKYLVPWRFHTPAYKLGRWDGSIRLFEDNGRIYSNLLPDVIPIIVGDGYKIDFVDNRAFTSINVPYIDINLFAHKSWPKGHKNEGEPILLREDQVEAANIFADNRYAIQELSTGYGKCLEYNTLIPVYTENKEVAEKLNIELATKSLVRIGKIYDCLTTNDEYYQESPVDENALMVYTPSGLKTPVRFVIKKFEPALAFTFTDGSTLTCADTHVFQYKGKPITALDLLIKRKKSVDANVFDRCKYIEKVVSIDKIPVYDISIDAPHWYVDANDIIHHNTILTAAICKQVEHIGRTLTIVPNKSLVRQTAKAFDLVGMDVSVYFSEEKDVSAQHVITTWQSLERIVKDKNKSPVAKQILEDIKRGLIQLTVDECHGAKSAVLDKLLSQEFANVPLRRGFTGTMPPEEFFVKTVVGNIGEIVHAVKAKDLQESGFLAECFVHGLVFDDEKKFDDYHQEYSYLTENLTRLQTLVSPIIEIAKTGNTLILVDRITSGEYLQQLLPNSMFVNGNTTLKERERIYELASNNDGLCIIATYGVAAVGIDIPRLYNVVLVEAGKSFIRIIQSIGRGLRLAKDKTYADIWDISSTCKFSKKHAKERNKYYSHADYPFTDVIGKQNDIIDYIKKHNEKVIK